MYSLGSNKGSVGPALFLCSLIMQLAGMLEPVLVSVSSFFSLACAACWQHVSTRAESKAMYASCQVSALMPHGAMALVGLLDSECQRCSTSHAARTNKNIVCCRVCM